MKFVTKITHAVSGISDGVRKQITGAIQGGIHSKYPSLPAIPIADIDGIRHTLKRLSEREAEAKQVKLSLDRSYTINGHTAKGYEFLYGHDLDKENPISQAAKALQESLKGNKDLIEQIRKMMAEDVLPRVKGTHQDPTKLSLDDPTQWSMAWSPMRNIYETGMTHIDRWASSLTDYQAATEQFWETISTHSLPFNLLILQKVGASQLAELKPKFEAAWTAEMDTLAEKGLLYMIDLSIFTTVKAQKVEGLTRFTPATITLLQQDPDTKALTPIAVRVSGHEDANSQVYTYPSSGSTSPSAWLYALQAAKVSLTVYGIWLGHVYHYHLVTAAMLMTLQETVPDGHPLRKLIDPQSKYLIEFDTVLLLIWKEIAPPASIASTPQFLEICNTLAAGHQFLQDDPLAALERNQIREADFTEKEPWDRYPVMKDYLEVWHACAIYTNAFVDDTYADDAAIVGDQTLQDWITNSADPSGGNIKGLPEMKD
ncbi:MAG: lipoxygenase family protein, partial [Bacteroidota bacterium]